ncbi:MAG: gliding motility-associated C-terminal domain-containing protein [Saprospiraceae bacterium]|nr:gliding motility-associated C-terminal domain-containing protein [Saprospiraceae bacterium]
MKRFFIRMLEGWSDGILEYWNIGRRNKYPNIPISQFPLFRIGIITFIIFLSIDKSAAQIAPPNLICVKNDTLFWNTPTNTCGAFRAYNIFFSENATGPYQILTTIINPNQNSYFRADAGNRVWYYYMTSDYNCPGQQSLSSDTLDNRIPEPPRLAYVGATPENDVVIGWRPSPSPEVFAYIISKNSPSGTITVDTVFNGLEYIDTTAQPDARIEIYFIVAIDRCGNSSLVPPPHSTMLLKAEGSSVCDRSVKLSWNAYQNWDGGVDSNKIWVTENGGSPKQVGFTIGNQNTFTFANAQPGIEYCFYVQAKEKNSTNSASSNLVCLTVDVIPGISELIATNATVTPDNKVNLTWFWNDNAQLDKLDILRAQGNTNFSAIASSVPTQPLTRDNNFLDENAKPSERAAIYKLQTTDACNVKTQSNTVSTIFLEVRSQGTGNLLQWTKYNNDYASDIIYEVYRQPDGSAPVFIATYPDGTFEHTDIVDANNPDAVGACYIVIAKVILSLPDGKMLDVASRSNLACATQELKLYIPNAFAPNGANREFKPILPFGELSAYSMVIYNRWGERVFETQNIEEGWDGKVSSRDMPQGGYVYHIRLTLADGKLAEYTGMLMLIR